MHDINSHLLRTSVVNDTQNQVRNYIDEFDSKSLQVQDNNDNGSVVAVSDRGSGGGSRIKTVREERFSKYDRITGALPTATKPTPVASVPPSAIKRQVPQSKS